MILDLSFIDKAATKKTPKTTRYQKPESLKELERLHFEQKKLRYPNIKESLLVKTSFKDDTSNELTKSIIAWIRLNGGSASRINTTGIYDVKLGKYRRSGSRKGMSDIVAIMDGKHISIEIKIKNDKMRPDQLKVKDEIERAGGVFITVSSFDNFLEQIKKYT